MLELVNTDGQKKTDRIERQEQINKFIHLLWNFRQENAEDFESKHARISAEMKTLRESLKIETLGGGLGSFDIGNVVAGFCQRAIHELEESSKPTAQKAINAVKWFSDGVEAIRLGTDYDAVKRIESMISQQGVRIQKAICEHVLPEGPSEYECIANTLQQIAHEMRKSDKIFKDFIEKP